MILEEQKCSFGNSTYCNRNYCTLLRQLLDSVRTLQTAAQWVGGVPLFTVECAGCGIRRRVLWWEVMLLLRI